jgi:hypothetical protein
MSRKLEGQLAVITRVELKTVVGFLIGLGLGLMSAGALLSSNEATVLQYDQDEISAPQESGQELTAPPQDGNSVSTWQLHDPPLAVRSNSQSNVPSRRSPEQDSVSRSQRSKYNPSAKHGSTISSSQLQRRLPPKMSSEVPRERPADSGQIRREQQQNEPIAGQLSI